MSSKGKSIHFLDPLTNAIAPLDPLTPPATPSPPLSASSLSSLPVRQKALLSAIESSTVVSIHTALLYGNQLRFNAALPIQLSSLAFQNMELSGHGLDFLAEPATSPPLPSLTITSDPSLPWHIQVRSSPPNWFVTVYDVLQTLHTNLRTPVSEVEMILFVTEETLDSIIEAFEDRVNAISDVRQREEQRAKFVRRIDCLMGRTRFLGLQRVGVEHPDMFTIGWGWP